MTHTTPRHPWAKALLLALFAISLCLPIATFAQAAQAADLSAWEPSPNDFTVYFLKSIFGDWKTMGDGQLNTLNGAMRVLNVFALAFGTLMFTYIAVVGTLKSAQDGEVMGKKWSSMWLPLRFTFSVSLMVPLASGYSTAQHFILGLAMIGGGAASSVWSGAMEAFTSPQAAVMAAMDSEDYLNKTRTLARKVLQAQVCSTLLQQSTPDGKFGASMRSAPPSKEVFYGGSRISWGALSGGLDVAQNTCGHVTMPRFTIDPISRNAGDFASMKSPASADQAAGFSALAAAQLAAIAAMDNDLSGVARALADAPAGVDAGANAAIERAAQGFLRATRAASVEVSTSGNRTLTGFIQASRETGWMTAATSFFQMSRITSAAAGIINAVPTFDKQPTSREISLPGVSRGPLFQDISSINDRIDSDFEADQAGGGALTVWTQHVTIWAAKMFTVDYALGSPHALVQLKNSGDFLLTSVEALATTVTLAQAAVNAGNESWVGTVLNKIIPAGTFVSEVVKITGPAIYLGFLGLFTVAITMSIILPMLPFVLMIGSITGWLMAVVSAVVAAPIWLAGHLHPDGDDVTGKGSAGYLILLETVTRPMFIIFGLLGAFAIMDPVLKFTAWTFRASMASVQGDSTTGIVSMIVFVSLYATIVFTVVRTSLDLINNLSTKVYLWIGGQHAGYDQAAAFGAGANAGLNKATQSIGGAGQAVSGAAAKRADDLMKANEGKK